MGFIEAKVSFEAEPSMNVYSLCASKQIDLTLFSNCEKQVEQVDRSMALGRRADTFGTIIDPVVSEVSVSKGFLIYY